MDDELDPATIREVYWRLDRLTSAVITSNLPPNTWFGWFLHLIWGYFQTEYGIEHPCGEDYSDWREAAEAAGIRLPVLETRRQWEQRQLYAELMAPKLTAQMVEILLKGGSGERTE